MATFEHDGETFWYDVLGTGAPVIVVHGGLGLDHTYLRPAFEPLADEAQVIFLDLRANGRSTGDGAGMTMAQLADDVDALRAHLGLEQVALFGHSYGGFVALQYALSHPDHLARLMLCDTDSRAPDEATIGESLQRLGVDPAVLQAFEGPRETHDDLLRVFDLVEPAYFPHSAPGAARAGLSETIWRKEGAEGGDAALDGWDVGDRLGEVTAPTLVATGADDFMFPPARAELLRDGIPGAELEVFERSGHLPHIEQPDEFHRVVLEFVRR